MSDQELKIGLTKNAVDKLDELEKLTGMSRLNVMLAALNLLVRTVKAQKRGETVGFLSEDQKRFYGLVPPYTLK